VKIVYSDRHREHAGAKEMRYDQMIPMCESPERMEVITAALREAGLDDFVEPDRFGLEPVHRVHSPGFIEFLESCYPLWEREFGPGGFATAYTFGMRGMEQTPNGSVHSMLSCYTFDVCVPFVKGTWAAIRSAVDVALTGAKLIQAGEGSAFSLCRPPGHHASGDLAGGYCYINNAAVAAQSYLDAGADRVAILDVDYHHGNGTQRIFYDRDDVLFVSLHARPEQEYPFLCGYAREMGAGRGEGFNVNLPMPLGTAIDPYMEALRHGLEKVRAFAPDILVVSLGVDTFAQDPVGGFKLLSNDYPLLGREIGRAGLPTHFVMEGGYAVDALGRNTTNVITGFLQG
jgi:acetoin utilization deacetylase AcuC-like enzyme